MARSGSGWRRLGCRSLACSRRTSLPRLRARPSAAHRGASVRKLDHSDAGGFPGETSARVQLYPQRAPGYAAARKRAAAAACPSPGSPLPCCLAGPLGRFSVRPAGRERGDFPSDSRLHPGTVGSTEGGRERGPQPKQIHRSGECACLFLCLPGVQNALLTDTTCLPAEIVAYFPVSSLTCRIAFASF